MSSSGYENMLEKYRDVDEDAIMSGLSKDELARLENEIDREILEKPPESDSDVSDMYTTTTTTSDEESESEDPQINRRQSEDEKEEEPQPQTIVTPASKKPEAFIRGKLDRTQLKPLQKTLQRQKSGGKHTFKLPTLKKTTRNRPDTSDAGAADNNSELKDELIQAVTKRNKRRTKRGNSSGVSIRRLSNAAFPKGRRNSKITRYRDGNEHQVDAATVNRNIMTDEMLNLRPRLRKVAVKEPKLVLPEELHGVSFNRITAGAKKLQDDEDAEAEAEAVASDDGDASRNSACGGYDADNDVTPSLSDESYVVLGEDIEEQKERQQALSECSEAPSDGVMTMASTTSTSAESCDVFGELSINPNSVEEMVERVVEDDPMLTEVNLNNIHDVPIERFEELAEAMENNTHVTSLTLANTGLTDRAAKALAKMLKRNSKLKKLNVESNFITGEGARRLVSALRKNTALIELLLDNQRHIFGAKVEFEIAKLLKENTSLLKFGYQFANPGPRMATSNILTKNMDIVRKRRVAEEKKRQQAGLPKRPTLRRQPSSEWYRKERLERLKKLQQQSKLLGLDLSSNIKDGEVEKVLKHMNPDEVAVLERWFTSKLLGMVDSPPKVSQDVEEQPAVKEEPATIEPDAKPSRGRAEIKQQKAQKDNLLRPPPRKSRSKSPVASRDDLMDSIRKQNTKLKKVQVRPFESPTYMDNMDSDVDIKPAGLKKQVEVPSNPVTKRSPSPRTEPEPPKLPVYKREEEPPVRQPPTILRTEPSIDQDSHPELTSVPSRKDKCSDGSVEGDKDLAKLRLEEEADESGSRATSSPEVREWVEGEEYDSDEYEIVEVEVTDTEEESDAPESKNQDSSDINRQISHSNNNNNSNSVPEENKPSVFPAPKQVGTCSPVPSKFKSAFSRFEHSRPEPFTKTGGPGSYEAVLNTQMSSPDRTPLGTPGSAKRGLSPRLSPTPQQSSRPPVSPTSSRSRSPDMEDRSPNTHPRHSASPIFSRATVRSPITPSINDSRSRETARRSPSPQSGHMSPLTPPRNTSRSPILTPRSPLMRQNRLDIPTYNRSTSSGSTGSSESSRSGSRQSSNRIPARTTRAGRSTNTEPEEEVKICPKAMSTIESFFSF